MQGLILQQEQWKLTVSMVEKSSHILLTVPIMLTDFHLFGPLKESLDRKKFSNDDEVKSTKNKQLRTQSKDFYAEGAQKLVFQWEKYVLKYEDYIEK